MRPKKNSKKDLNRNRSLYFLIGLTLVMLLTYTALEWKTYDNYPEYVEELDQVDELIDEIPPVIDIKLPPPPMPIIPDIIEIKENEEEIIETIIESTETNQTEEVIAVSDIIIEEVPEDLEINIIAVEEKPVFPGCENEKDKLACFQKMMGKHIVKNFRYPELQKVLGVQGKVFVKFIIQKDGTIGNVQMRGPDKGLEKEAARIISKLPKMKPGKQGGKAVKVPFSIPITFKLQ